MTCLIFDYYDRKPFHLGYIKNGTILTLVRSYFGNGLGGLFRTIFSLPNTKFFGHKMINLGGKNVQKSILLYLAISLVVKKNGQIDNLLFPRIVSFCKNPK